MPPSLAHLDAEARRYASPPPVYVLTWTDRHGHRHSRTSTDLSKLIAQADQLAQQGAVVEPITATRRPE